MMWSIGQMMYTIHLDRKKYDASLIGLFELFHLGMIGLLVIGIFLHVFEDSMVNYLFFVPYGILF